MWKRATSWYPLGVFLASALFVAWCSASRFADNIDEGIYLDGAWRLAQGQMLYRDFFQYLAPGTFLLLGALFKIFGHSLAISRLPVTVDLGLMTALVFLLVGKLATRGAAVVAALCFLAFQTFNSGFIVANHRWDSSACALAAVTFGFFLLEKRSHVCALGAGLFAGMAACTTWSLGLLCVVLLGWLLCDRSVRPQAISYVAGMCVVPFGVLGWLSANHALLSMIDGVLWSMRNYTGPNRTVYGLVIGGYEQLYRHAGPLETLLMSTFLISATLPATMPVLCLAGWPVRLRFHPERRILYLLVCAAAIVTSTWPRPDMTHLMYVSALPYVLSFTLLARVLGARPRFALAGVLLLVATCEIGYAIHQRLTEPWLTTRVGAVHGKAKELDVLRTIQASVEPSETLFVFPYWPVFYFTTGARNPTRFSYLQPGMFPKQDEDAVLRTLRAHPPDAVVYRAVAPASYLKIWPSSDPTRLRMAEIEDFLRDHYRVAAGEGKFQILRPRLTP